MEKVYKHKQTGFVAKELPFNLEDGGAPAYQINSKGYGTFIPAMIVEEGDDWELLREGEDDWAKSFKTKDGYTITDAFEYVYGIQADPTIPHTYLQTAEHMPLQVKLDSSWEWYKFKETRDRRHQELTVKPFIFTTTDGIGVADPERSLWQWDVESHSDGGKIRAKYAVDDRNPSHKYFYTHEDMANWVHEWDKQNKPKVILTTQDGVDITDRNTMLYIVKHTWEVYDILSEYRNSAKANELIFSSKAKRDEYILQMKPLLSLSEVRKTIQDSYGYYKNSQQARQLQLNKLEELAKSKLK